MVVDAAIAIAGVTLVWLGKPSPRRAGGSWSRTTSTCPARRRRHLRSHGHAAISHSRAALHSAGGSASSGPAAGRRAPCAGSRRSPAASAAPPPLRAIGSARGRAYSQLIDTKHDAEVLLDGLTALKEVAPRTEQLDAVLDKLTRNGNAGCRKLVQVLGEIGVVDTTSQARAWRQAPREQPDRSRAESKPYSWRARSPRVRAVADALEAAVRALR